jgi:hypothetical protein
MPFLGFEGPAGTGKTYQLIEEIGSRAPKLLSAGQRVLGLTFMHGSRRRLDASFANKPELRRRGFVTTIDSFAAQVMRRWHSIAPRIDDYTEFDRVCDACGVLLERPEMAQWVSAAFPLIAIDEAQELKPCRLRIAQALSKVTQMVVAADEFQCLDDELDTQPFMQWFETGDLRRLSTIRRTNRQGLLDAGVALRSGQAPKDGVGLKIKYDFPNQAKFAVGHALRGGSGTRAILVAPGSSGWASELIAQLGKGLQSKSQSIPPLLVAWDAGPGSEVTRIVEALCGPTEQVDDVELRRRITLLSDAPAWLAMVASGIHMARRAHGVRSWAPNELFALCRKRANIHYAYSFGSERGIQAMTIQGAKNRQFRDVVVLWGPGVPGSDDYKRRLLYNAISRAEHNCTVFVRTKFLLEQPPFA